MPALGSLSPCSFYLDGGTLVLKGLKAEDSGAYTCVAHNAAGEDARLHTVSVLGERLQGEELRGLCHPGAAAAWPQWGLRQGIWRVVPGPGCRSPASSPAMPTL